MSLKIKNQESLARYTTFKIGGPADWFCVVKTTKDLKEAVQWAKDHHLPYFILAGGSNLLISDRGFRGLIIKITNYKLQITNYKNYALVEAGAGVLINQLVKFTIDHGLVGLENFFGLYGSVGGAVTGNAHFQGQKIRQFVSKVKKYQDIILSVVFKLKKGDKKELEKGAKEVWDYRRKTQPLNFPSAGCIFKNPGKQSAGYLIAQCGLKEKKHGGAMISAKHANFIINTGQATAKDVSGLIDICRKKVKEKFGINLKEEIQKVGDFSE